MALSGSERSSIEGMARVIRGLAMDAVQRANSGHPGMPMGCAEIGSVIWARHLKFSSRPGWLGRDRFVLSAGHGSMLLYSLLHLFDGGLSIEDLKSFRQWESKTPGHPEYGLTDGVDTTTGPLGQGFANGVGMAAASQILAQRLSSDLFPSRIFGIVSDGDLMEGISAEAASLAGHLQLGNIVYVYDDNEISIGGSTNVCFTESVAERFRAYNWHVLEVDGHDIEAVDTAIEAGVAETSRPTLIVAKTTIAFGSPNLAGSADAHGSPLGEDEVRAAKVAIGLDPEQCFFVDPEVKSFCSSVVTRNEALRTRWEESFEPLRPQFDMATQTTPELYEQLCNALSALGSDATRNISGKAIQIIASHLPHFVGGSADLEPSNKTLIKTDKDFSPQDFAQRNIRFGVREHAMGAFTNGMAYHGGFLPYCATFLVFADYLRPAIRLAALSHLQSLYIFTHDSFWVGEDGPTHQPIEHIESLRLIPNLHVYRPADGAEVAASYWSALRRTTGPSALLFTRQALPPIGREREDHNALLQGGYVVRGQTESVNVVVATGSELHLACEAAELLSRDKLHVRVVSMPCVESFLEQPLALQRKVIPEGARLASIEAGSTMCWRGRFGGVGLALGIDHFGASAPGAELAEQFGFTARAVAEKLQGYFA